MIPSAIQKPILKIGLFRRGRLVSERVLQIGEKLDIGTGPSATIRLEDVDDLGQHILIDGDRGQFFLNLAPGFDGKVSLAEGTVDLGRMAQNPPEAARLPLGAKARGRLKIGEDTILFQVLPAPPPPRLKGLPQGMQGGFLRRMDAPFAILMVLSAFMHLGMILYVNSLPVSEELSEAEVARIIKITTNVTIDDIPPADEVPEDKPLEGEKEKKPAKPKGGAKAKGALDDEEKEPERVETKGLLALITSDRGSGSVADIINSAGSDSGLNDILSKIGSGVGIAKVGGSLKSKGDGASAVDVVGAQGLGRTGTAKNVGTGEKKEHKVVAKVSSSGGVSGALNASTVRGVIRRYVGGIRYCYEKQLKIDPTLKGKISVAFGIDGDGRVASCSVTSNTLGNASVGSCVCRRIRRWRFSPPEQGGSSSVNYTFIFTPAAG